MAADGEPAREGGGRADGDEEDDVDDEATLFSLELELAAGHRSSSLDHQEEETDKKEDGDKAIGGREVSVAAVHVEASSRRGGVVAEALGTVGPAARLRTLVRKLLKLLKAKSAAVAEEERRTPAETALMYLSKVPIRLACRSGMADVPGDTSPPHSPQATTGTALPVPGRKSRGEIGLLGQARKLRLGVAAGSSVAALLPPPTPPRRDDSLLQAQDGVAGAIAYCKLSLA